MLEFGPTFFLAGVILQPHFAAGRRIARRRIHQVDRRPQRDRFHFFDRRLAAILADILPRGRNNAEHAGEMSVGGTQGDADGWFGLSYLSLSGRNSLAQWPFYARTRWHATNAHKFLLMPRRGNGQG